MTTRRVDPTALVPIAKDAASAGRQRHGGHPSKPVTSAESSPRARGHALPLRGRAAELALLRSAIEALSVGEGRVIVIEGAPGSGKTAVLREAQSAAVKAGVLPVRAWCDPTLDAIPFAPLFNAIRGVDHEFLRSDDIRALIESTDQPLWLLVQVREFLERLSIGMPVLVTIDDVQWADKATLSALSLLPRQLAAERISWLIATRPTEPSSAAAEMLRELARTGAAQRTLGYLDEEAIALATNDVLGARPDEALMAALARTGGQPFLLLEYLHGALEDGLVEIDRGLARLVGDVMPNRVPGMIATDLGRLSDVGQALVQTAAVLGRRFSTEELGAMLGHPTPMLIAPLREVIRAGYLVDDNGMLSFRHDLLREGVAASMPQSMRDDVRRHAADVMLRSGATPTEVAAIVSKAARSGDEDAVTILVKAAHEISRVSPAVAAHLTRRALELTPSDSNHRPSLILDTVNFLGASGHATAISTLLASVGHELDDPTEHALAHLNFAGVATHFQPVAAAKHLRQALAVSGVPGDLRVNLLSALACVLELSGELDAAADAAGRAMTDAYTLGDPARFSLPWIAQALVEFTNGEWDKAVSSSRQATSERVHPDNQIWIPSGWRAMILLSGHRFDEAEPLIADHLRQAHAVGSVRDARVWTMFRCRLTLGLGRLNDARAEADAIFEMGLETGPDASGYIESVAEYVAGIAATHVGDSAQLAAARNAVRRMHESDCSSIRGLGHSLSARLDLVATEAGVDNWNLAEIDRLAREPIHAGVPREHADSVTLIRALRNRHPSGARRIADRLDDQARVQPGFPGLLAAARQGRGLADGDATALLESVDLYRNDPRPLVRAGAFEDTGRELIGRQHRDGVAFLDQALASYNQCEARVDARRVRRLLRSHGVHRPAPTRIVDSVWPELTTSELAVARLVALGATNREAAQQLFISPYTVSSHLRHAFDKLGIRSRVDLARIVTDRDRG